MREVGRGGDDRRGEDGRDGPPQGKFGRGVQIFARAALSCTGRGDYKGRFSLTPDYKDEAQTTSL